MRKREWGIRVGPAVPCKPPSFSWRWVMYFITRRWKNRKGILALPALWWIYAGIAYGTAAFWAIVYYMADKPDQNWF